MQTDQHGGTELLANIIKVYKPYSKTGTIMIIIDTIIIAENTLLFRNIEIALYSALAIYVMGKVLDILFEGINFTKMLLIISPKNEEISREIGNRMDRGTTAIYGRGMYKRQDKEILLCVISRNQLIEARRIIKQIDPNAFIIITNAREVYGEGFKMS